MRPRVRSGAGSESGASQGRNRLALHRDETEGRLGRFRLAEAKSVSLAGGLGAQESFVLIRPVAPRALRAARRELVSSGSGLAEHWRKSELAGRSVSVPTGDRRLACR
jgi:hypothetical protein